MAPPKRGYSVPDPRVCYIGFLIKACILIFQNHVLIKMAPYSVKASKEWVFARREQRLARGAVKRPAHSVVRNYVILAVLCYARQYYAMF